MGNELVRKNLETSLTLGGLSDLVKATENVMLLIDTSGSMEQALEPGSTRRCIDALRDVVRDIQGTDHVPMIAFGGPYDAQVRFVDNVPEPDGGTPLHLAIPLAKEYGATRLVVISDGLPDLREQTLEEARRFGGRIDVVFVGVKGDAGNVFLKELARMTGGTAHEGKLTETKQLTSMVIGLLAGEVAPARGPIQGPGFTATEAEPEDDEPADDDDEFEDDDEDSDDEDDEDDDE